MITSAARTAHFSAAPLCFSVDYSRACTGLCEPGGGGCPLLRPDMMVPLRPTDRTVPDEALPVLLTPAAVLCNLRGMAGLAAGC
jgi:hypothetical protein